MSRPADDPAAWLATWAYVTVDRPLGANHPDGAPVYPVNYGSLPGTEAADGEEIDAYVLGPHGAVTAAYGRVVAVLHRRDDVEDKLVVATDGRPRDDEEIAAAVAFQERHFDTRILSGPSYSGRP